jgi:hypothetical protein
MRLGLMAEMSPRVREHKTEGMVSPFPRTARLGEWLRNRSSEAQGERPSGW